MELGAFIAPSRGWLDTYKAANFNKYNIVISADANGVPTLTEEDLIAALNLCAEKGIDAQIQLHHALVKKNYNVFTEAYPNIDFKEYSAFKGFYIVDEPTWYQIEYIDDNYIDWFNENYGNSDYEFYVNLLNSYSSAMGAVRDANGNYVTDGSGNKLFDNATEEQKEICYNAYVKKWLTVFEKINSNKKYFTIDSYPLLDNQVGLLTLPGDELPEGYERYIADNWLYVTYRAATNAVENSLSFGAFIQACDEGGEGSKRSFRLPSKVEEIKWQAYMNIAFGAKKLTYYGYDQSSVGTYMTENGQPLNLYYLVQETNAELDKIDHVIAAFETWVGVKTFLGENSTTNAAFEKIAEMELDKLTGVSSVTASRDLVVGEMVDGSGNHGYMLVGYDDPFNENQTQVSMTFDGAKGFIVYRGGERTLCESVDGKLSLTLAAGEGVFIIPVYAE